jgi:phage-related protein
MEAQANSVGATDAAFAEIDKSRSMERLGIIFKNLAIQVGTILLPLIEDIAKSLGEWLKGAQPQIVAFAEAFRKGETPLNDFFDTLKDTFNFLLNNLNTILIVGTAIGGFMAIVKTLTAIINIAKAAQALFNIVMAANPVMLVVIAIAALIAGLIYFFTQTEVGRIAWQMFTDFLAESFANVVSFFETSFNNISEWWTTLITNITSFFTTTWDNAVQIFSDIINNVSTVFTNVFNGIGNFFKGVINTYIGFWEGFFNFFINGINFMIGAINSIKIDVPDWLRGLSGGASSFGFNIPKLGNVSLPRLAEGGVVMPQNGGVLAQIAEAGEPEAVIPLDKLDKMLSGVGTANTGVTVNVYPSKGMSEKDLADAVGRRVKWELGL